MILTVGRLEFESRKDDFGMFWGSTFMIIGFEVFILLYIKNLSILEALISILGLLDFVYLLS